MPKKIARIYFVKKDHPIGGENILGRIIPNIIPSPFVKSGDTFSLDHNMIGHDPFPKQPKDLVVIIEENGVELEPLRFSERDINNRENQDRGITITIPWSYEPKTEKQLKEWYESKRRDGSSEFIDYADFMGWYEENVKDKRCHYCELTERESQEIIHTGLLTSNRFPLNGRFSQGVNRGYWLEVDRRNPKGKYSRENCVPSCYFCNNDKSDVFTEEQYKEFMKDRIGFIKKLLN